MARLEKLCARGVFDPPGYSQIIKVTGAQSLLFLAGQVPYAAGGGVDHPGDFLAQRATCSALSRRTWRRRAGR
jgi:enamine deaminase RidA (YjgF/YER057c/UK114 family)